MFIGWIMVVYLPGCWLIGCLMNSLMDSSLSVGRQCPDGLQAVYLLESRPVIGWHGGLNN